MAREIKISFTLKEQELNTILEYLNEDKTLDELTDAEFAKLKEQVEADDARHVYTESFEYAEIELLFED